MARTDQILSGVDAVDSTVSICRRYSSEEMASITFGVVMASSPVEGTVHGTKGNIKIHSTMHNPTKLTVELSGDSCYAYLCDWNKSKYHSFGDYTRSP